MLMDDKGEGSIFHYSRHSLRKISMLITCACILIVCVVLTYVSVGGVRRAYADFSSFSQGVSSGSATQALFWFQPSGWTAGYVILHYNQPGVPLQNVTMAYNNGTARWEYTAGEMSSRTGDYLLLYLSEGWIAVRYWQLHMDGWFRWWRCNTDSCAHRWGDADSDCRR